MGLYQPPLAGGTEFFLVMIEDCRDWRADLVIVGSHGRHGMDRLLPGSVSEAVAVHAPCPVEVLREASPGKRV